MSHPKIWTPDNQGASERKVLKVSIVDAEYLKDQGFLVVNVALPDGRHKKCPIPFSNKYRGQILSDAEAHKQMEKTAELFRKNRGRNIKIMADDEQVADFGDGV